MLLARLERLEAQRRRVSARGRDSERDELLALEAQVAALQRAAATAREEAELALEETTRELHRRLVSSTLGRPAAPRARVPRRPGARRLSQRCSRPRPPCRPGASGSRARSRKSRGAPSRSCQEVRSAVTDVLETAGPPLRLGPDEFVVVVVDFLPRSAFATRTRPARTLVVRVRKRELEDRAAGKLASDELRKRIEYSEY